MSLEIPLWFEIGSYVALLLIIAADVFIAYRRPHVPSTRESALWITFYVVLALIFAGLMLAFAGTEHAGQFVAGWLTEYSLSIDNLFVFLIIMARFSVPRKYQQEILMVGIILALVFRGIFILLGAALISNFSWIFYIFGLFLIYTAANQAFTSHDDEEEMENRLIRMLRRRIAITDGYDGAKLKTTIDGKRVFTPVLIVFIALGTTDLVFALDSIPAIFGITQEPFIVFTANVFALMGLRQLYFLLGRPGREAGLPEVRDRRHPGVHRREAVLPRPARERAALHQRRAARRVGAGDRHVRVARGDRGRDGGRGDRERHQAAGGSERVRRVPGPTRPNSGCYPRPMLVRPLLLPRRDEA